MLFWILAALALYFASLFLSVALYLPKIGLLTGLGARDMPADRSVIGARADRAAENLKENMIIFLPLALLSMVVEAADQALAVQGAMVFVVLRVVYIPAYMSGVLGLRTLVFGGSVFGLLMMVAALI